MTQAEIDNLKVGDWLRIANLKTPAARVQREAIVAIKQHTFCNAQPVRVATVVYYSGNTRVNKNDCELNTNLFGDMELID